MVCHIVMRYNVICNDVMVYNATRHIVVHYNVIGPTVMEYNVIRHIVVQYNVKRYNVIV